MTKKALCMILSVVLCLLSVFVNPVNTVVALETQNTSTESILPYNKMFLGVGDTYEIDLLIDVDEYYVFSLNYDVVSVVHENSCYKIVGESVGTATIYVNYYNQNGILTTNTCEVKVFEEHSPISTDEFYLYLNSREVVLSANPASFVHYVQPWSTRVNERAVWTIAPIDEHYYTIKLESQSIYLGVNDNGQIQLYSTSTNTPTKWRILVDHSAKTVIVPQSKEHTNMALGYDGNNAVLANYYTDLSARNWRLLPRTFYIDNYYDSSALETLDGTRHNRIRGNFMDANDFVTTVYESFGVSVQVGGLPTYRTDFMAESCPLGDNSPCNSSCETDHKDANIMSMELYNSVSRKNNHIVVLWADRQSSVYTDDGLSRSGDIIAHHLRTEDLLYGTQYYPVIDFFTITKLQDETIEDSTTVEAIMSISLAHEMAHVFEIGEVALSKDENRNDLHSNDTVGACIMNYLTIGEMREYYEDLVMMQEPYFCSSCQAFLEERIPEIRYYGNSN